EATSEPALFINPFPSSQPAQVPLRQPGNQAGNQRPTWMPDRGRLILSVEGHLRLIDTRGGDSQFITATTAAEIQPAVSPDGRRIAFASGNNDFDIVQISLDAGSVKPILVTARTETDPAWSPLNSQFAYVTTSSGLPEIWLRSAQDGGARPIVQQDSSLTWYDLEKLHFS